MRAGRGRQHEPVFIDVDAQNIAPRQESDRREGRKRESRIYPESEEMKAEDVFGLLVTRPSFVFVTEASFRVAIPADRFESERFVFIMTGLITTLLRGTPPASLTRISVDGRARDRWRRADGNRSSRWLGAHAPSLSRRALALARTTTASQYSTVVSRVHLLPTGCYIIPAESHVFITRWRHGGTTATFRWGHPEGPSRIKTFDSTSPRWNAPSASREASIPGSDANGQRNDAKTRR